MLSYHMMNLQAGKHVFQLVAIPLFVDLLND
jgi:hypothetical protein